jgi:hypothetical protein
MFGLSDKEKFKKQFYSVLSNFLVMYPGGVAAAHQEFPRLKTQVLKADRRPAWHALLITRELFIRTIDRTMTPEERDRIGKQLDSLDMQIMRQWTIQAIGGKTKGGSPGLHPATVYIAAAECVADLFHLAKQYGDDDREQFSHQINQALIGMTKEERDGDRIERIIDILHEDDDEEEGD